MTKFYDGSVPGFYDADSKTDSAVEISDDVFEDLIKAQSQGMRIVADSNGYPMLAEPLPPTDEELAAAERAWRDSQLIVADDEIRKHEDEDATATSTEKAWRTYRSVLRAWPSSEHFPDKEHRPVEPS